MAERGGGRGQQVHEQNEARDSRCGTKVTVSRCGSANGVETKELENTPSHSHLSSPLSPPMSLVPFSFSSSFAPSAFSHSPFPLPQSPLHSHSPPFLPPPRKRLRIRTIRQVSGHKCAGDIVGLPLARSLGNTCVVA